LLNQASRSKLRAFIFIAIFVGTPGCLVLTVNPAYDQDSLTWDSGLVGKWVNAEDNVSMEIQRGEWRSYNLAYQHPIEKGELTGYLTAIGDERYLDVMPARGQDRGSFLVPVHALVRVRLTDDKLELTPLSYDWFFDRVRARRAVAGLTAAFDQKENALIISPTAELRAWLRVQPADGPMFGASATFVRRQ
jgi:hypothetical protein